MQTLKQPYELLVRWDQAGRVNGAHVQYRYVIKDEAGVIVGESIANAEPVAADSEFPTCDIMSQMHSDVMAEVERLKKELELAASNHAAELAAQKEGYEATIGQLRNELATA